MRSMKLNTGLRIGFVVCILALALTAAYYYGTARAASVVALPTELTLGNAATDATSSTTVRSAATVSSAPSTPANLAPAATTGSTATGPTAASVAAPSSSSTPSVQRHVVTTVWDWNCGSGNWGSGRGGW